MIRARSLWLRMVLCCSLAFLAQSLVMQSVEPLLRYAQAHEEALQIDT
jgi:hypothetical protein